MSIERWFRAIQRRRLPQWLVAYAAAAWGCAEATALLIDNYGAPQRLLDAVLFLLLVLLFVVLILAWYHGERGAQRPTRAEASLLGVLVCVGLVGTVSIATGSDRVYGAVPDGIVVADLGERSLAVLPFRSTVDDPGLTWLSRGVAELLSTHLAQVEDLRVVSSQRIADLIAQLGLEPDAAVPESVAPVLMQAAGARLAVHGSVFGSPGDLTIAATLVDVATGQIRASASERGSDVIALADLIASGLGLGIEAGDARGEPASLASLATADIQAYRAYEEGRRASLRYLHAEAAEHYRRALQRDSTFALARFRLALSLHKLGFISEAAAEGRRARSELGPASERDRLFVEAFDYFATDGDTARAVATVRELVRKYPDDKDARIIFAAHLVRLRGGADPEARALLHETLELDPSYAAGYNVLAYSYAGSGDLAAADSFSRRYVELEPDQPNSWDSRGEILELAGRVEEAREAYRQALRVRPDFRVAINHLARSHLLEDDPAGARRALADLLASPLADVRVRAMALVGDTHLWEGAVDEAVAAYEGAEREAASTGLAGLRAWRLRDLVRLRLALGDHGPAIEAADALRRLEPVDGWWITALFDSLASRGDVAGMERRKPEVLAEISGDPLTRGRREPISSLIDLWMAHGLGDHDEVLRLASGLRSDLRPGVLTGWPVFRSMLELGRTDELLREVRAYRSPDLFSRGPRFQPLLVRWGQYFEARAHEAAGDTAEAVADYEALVRGMGDGVARFPTLADAPARLERLRAEPSGR